MTISNKGVYFDSKAQKVVESPPEEGVQIVAPGGEMTDEAQAEIERYKALAAGETPAPETVTTARATGRK